jgi:tetratricopeptide (TPR) repeat protein
LANSPAPKFRDPDEAVTMASRAVELSPNQGSFWNSLGAARYRAGDWHGALEALKKSEGLAPGRSTSCCNALFLAMANWNLGEQDEARRWYGLAVERMKTEKGPNEEELRRFQGEADELLKMTDQKPTTNPPVDVK